MSACRHGQDEDVYGPQSAEFLALGNKRFL